MYATLAGREQFGKPGDYKHEADLTPELVRQSFFDVVGDGKSYTGLGQAGLNRALNRWRKAREAGILKPIEYMGMPIHPRIEVMTPSMQDERPMLGH
ncbi:MAG TPA: hypothetical protein PKD72_09255 [Gemmatales bacterium]|nr:hypothetical protein [Gemmatales bacterium]